MDLYVEFFSAVSMFNKLGIRYAIVGGIALAFHGRLRFTRDVDVLVNGDNMELVTTGLGSLGYEETAEPWMLPNTTLTLRRFLKVEGQDELMIDVLVASDDAHLRVIQDAVLAESTAGSVPVATRRDLVFYRRIPKVSDPSPVRDEQHHQGPERTAQERRMADDRCRTKPDG
jgi:hypothetical protein